MKKDKLYNIITLFALIGLLISSYLTYNHYFEQSAVCLPGQEKSCDIVLKGPYATLFFGVPNALIGMLGFGLILILSRLKTKNAPKLIFFSSLLSALFVIYLAYLIFFVIEAFCQWCFLAWICIYTIFITSILLLKAKN